MGIVKKLLKEQRGICAEVLKDDVIHNGYKSTVYGKIINAPEPNSILAEPEIDVEMARIFKEITVIYKKGQWEYDFKAAYTTLDEAIKKTDMDFQRYTGNLPEKHLYKIIIK